MSSNPWLDIVFNDAQENPSAVYKPGQNVLFNVRLTLTEPLKCRGVMVRIYGGADVEWTTGGKNSTTHTSMEIYINQQQQIFVPPADGPIAGCHPAGQHSYPMWFTLPNTVPTSYQEAYGSIRYYVAAIIERPWQINNQVRKFFTVIHDLDLNEKPMDLVGPYRTDEEDEEAANMSIDCCSRTCCCLGSGQIVANLRVDKRGYVPGEEIPIVGEIRNGSGATLSKVAIHLVQKAEYHATGGNDKTCCREAATVELPGEIPSGQSVQLNYKITVPPLVSSYIPGCSIIEVSYMLKAVASTRNCQVASLDCCPIVIGTVPLRSTGPREPTKEAPSSSMSNPGALPPPPTYTECVFGRMEMKDTDGQAAAGNQTNRAPRDQWAPMYPVFSVYA